MKKIAVVAIGGNSLIKDENHQTFSDQLEAVRQATLPIACMVKQGWKIVITHGNGPQIGSTLLKSELASRRIPRAPLHSLGAETQGAIGYMIQQSLQNQLKKKGVQKTVATVVTQTVVKADDTAFKNPTKPIGPFYELDEKRKLRKEKRWKMIEDAGRGWRRVVPSPTPVRIVEHDVIKTLVCGGTIVVAVGGGGIPVLERRGKLVGIEAVIDKDLSSALLAIGLKADLFLISTAVEKVALNFGKPNECWLDELSLAEAEKYLEEGQFPAGSMGPKIQAVINYLKNGGKKALISDPRSIERALKGKTGTLVARKV